LDAINFKVFINDVEQFDYALDPQIATISFPSLNLSGSEDIRFSGEYLSEVRFSMEALNIAKISADSYQVTGISLTEEINNSIGGYSVNDFINYPSFYFTLPFEPKSSENISAEVLVSSLDNDRELRRKTTDSSTSQKILESNVVTEKEKNSILTWFLVAKGKLIQFVIPPCSWARFNTDTLSLTLVRGNTSAPPLYSYQDLGLKQFDFVFAPDYDVSILATVGTTIDYEAKTGFAEIGEKIQQFYMTTGVLENNIQYSRPRRWLKAIAEVMVGTNPKCIILRMSASIYDYFFLVNEPSPAYLEDFNDLVTNFIPGSKIYLLIDYPNASASVVTAFLRYFESSFSGTNGYPAFPPLILDSITVFKEEYPTDAPLELYLQILTGGGTSLPSIYSLAYCVKLERENAETYGFTSLNQDIEIDGVIYKSHSAIDTSATATEINLSTDNLEIKSLINNEEITPQKLLSGYFDDAIVKLALIDFITVPATFEEGIILLQGRVGKVTFTDTTFTFELRSLSELLNKPVSKKTSPKCDHIFGGIKCKLDLITAGLQLENIPILAIADRVLTLDTTGITSSFVNGTALVKTGANNGLLLEVTAVNPSSQQITFRGELAENFQVGDLLELTAFCQKDQFTCQGYGNYDNFGGVPVGGNFVPGLDRISVLP
jgi:uncharacterized phage protein (TIGR02218 family)